VVAHSSSAMVARTARNHGIERDTITLFQIMHASANLIDHTSDFVSWHERENRTKMTAVQVQIRAAHASHGNPNPHLASPNFGCRNFSSLEVVFFGDDGGTHCLHYFTAPMVKP
jgi:hypothetical protein